MNEAILAQTRRAIKDAYCQEEARKLRTDRYQLKDSPANHKALDQAARNCLSINLDAPRFVEYANLWVGRAKLFPNMLGSMKLVEYIKQDLPDDTPDDSPKFQSFNERLRQRGMHIPKDNREYSSAEFDLLIAIQDFNEWLPRTTGCTFLTDEIIEKYITKPFYNLDPLIVYTCGSHEELIRELFHDRAVQRLEEEPLLKEAMLGLGFQPIGLDLR